MYREPAPRPKMNVCNTCQGEFLVADTVLTPTGTWACRGCDARMRAQVAGMAMQGGLTSPLDSAGQPTPNNQGNMKLALRIGFVVLLVGLKACLAFHR